MSENLKKFLEKIGENEELKAKFTAALADKDTAAEKILEIARECGITLTKDDFRQEDGEELSPEDLEKVAGGSFFGLMRQAAASLWDLITGD